MSAEKADVLKFGRLAPPIRSRVLEVAVWGFILVSVGRIGEVIPGLSVLPLAKIMLGLSVIALMTKWSSLPAVGVTSLSLFKTIMVLAALVLVSVPFSIWPGQSVVFLYQQFPVLILTVVLICKLSYEWTSVRNLLLVLVVSGALLAVPALQGYSGGRARVDSMYDTNDLAYILVTIFPLALGFFLVARSKSKRLLALAVTVALVATILLTSSRGGFLALIAATTLILIDNGKFELDRGPGAASVHTRRRKGRLSKVMLAVFVCACLSAVVWPMLPDQHQQRILSVLNLESDYNLDPENDKGRLQIWQRGADALVARPFGYGVNASLMVDLRFGGRMMAPHSSLMEVGVELGVLGAYLFLQTYALAYFGLGRARRRLQMQGDGSDGELKREQSVFFRMLQASLVGNLIAGLFLTLAYATILWAIVAIAMGCLSLSPAAAKGKAVRVKTGVNK